MDGTGKRIEQVSAAHEQQLAAAVKAAGAEFATEAEAIRKAVEGLESFGPLVDAAKQAIECGRGVEGLAPLAAEVQAAAAQALVDLQHDPEAARERVAKAVGVDAESLLPVEGGGWVRSQHRTVHDHGALDDSAPPQEG